MSSSKIYGRIFDRYCSLRAEQISAEIQNRDEALIKEIKQVKEIHKMYIRHYQFDHLNHTSRHSQKYVLVLLVVILTAILLGGNGA